MIIFSTHVLNYFWGNYAIFCIKLTAFFIKVSAQPIAEKKLSGLRFSNNILLIIHVNMLPKLLKFIPAKNTYVHVNLNSMECINVTCLTQSLYTGLYNMNDIKKHRLHLSLHFLFYYHLIIVYQTHILSSFEIICLKLLLSVSFQYTEKKTN